MQTINKVINIEILIHFNNRKKYIDNSKILYKSLWIIKYYAAFVFTNVTLALRTGIMYQGI